MAEGSQRVRVEGIEWSDFFPAVRLFRAFRMAIHPWKLLLALLLVVLLYLSGRLLDFVGGPQVYPHEIQAYGSMNRQAFTQWRDRAAQADRFDHLLRDVLDEDGVDSRGPDRFERAIEATQRDYAEALAEQRRLRQAPGADPQRIDREINRLRREREARLDAILSLQPRGVFETALGHELNAFERLVAAASVLNFGVGDVLRGATPPPESVAGALRDMLVIVPGWLYRTHRTFLLAYCVVAMLLWSLLGGAIARMAAVHATGDQRLPVGAALRFALRHWVRFLLAPIIPVLIAVVLALLLMLFGLVFFGIPYVHHALDVVGGLLFVVALLLGLALSLLLIGLALSFNLLYPAVAVDGADGFDANSRAFSYAIGRPWHLLFYHAVALVYGALTYLFFAAVVFLTMLLTQELVSTGTSALAGGQVAPDRFDGILPPPQVGRLAYRINWEDLGLSGRIAAVLTLVWAYLLIGLLAAYAISFYFSAQTWIYLLLRRSADGTELDEVFLEPNAADEDQPAAAARTPEKLERPRDAAPPGPTPPA